MLQKLLQKNARSGIYYYRWKLPEDLRALIGKHELVKSLRTRDQTEAMSRAIRVQKVVDQIKDLRIQFQMKELTEENYQEAVDLLWDRAHEATTESEYDISKIFCCAKHDITLREFITNGCNKLRIPMFDPTT